MSTTHLHSPAHPSTPRPAACQAPRDDTFRPPPELPTPNAEEVLRFQSLFQARFGVELTEEQADDQARRLVQFVFLMQHAIPRLKRIQLERIQADQARQEQELQEPRAAREGDAGGCVTR